MQHSHVTRRAAALVTVLALVALLTSSALAATPVEITVFHTTTHGYDRWVQAGLDEFNARNPGVHATLVTGNVDRLITLVAGGTPPDVIHGPGDRFIPEWAYQGLIQPLDRYVEQSELGDMVPTLLPILSWKGNLYGLPRNWSAGGIISNATLFEERGVALPEDHWTWDDFLNTARRMTYDTSGDGTPDVFGFSGLFANAHRFPAWLWSGGGELWNEDMTRSTLDSPASREAMAYYERIWLTEGVSSISHGVGTSRTVLMAESRVAMVHELSQTTGIVLEDNPTFKPYVSPLPISPAGEGRRTHIAVLDYLTMYNHTPHPEEAWKVIEFLTSAEGFDTGMDLTPIMGYQSSLPSRMGYLRDAMAVRNIEMNPTAWIDISLTMRGTEVTHPVLGNDVNVIISGAMGAVRRGEMPMHQAIDQIVTQLNARVNEAIQAGHSW